MDFRVVYTRSARCLLAIVRRLSPSFSPSRRKNEIRNGIKGWVGEKKWMTFSGWCGAWRSFSSLTCELYCITKAKLSKRGRERKKKNVTCARRLLVYRASHFYRRTAVKPLTLSGLSNPIRTNRNIRSTITKTLRLSA